MLLDLPRLRYLLSTTNNKTSSIFSFLKSLSLLGQKGTDTSASNLLNGVFISKHHRSSVVAVFNIYVSHAIYTFSGRSYNALRTPGHTFSMEHGSSS
jgi:hypothetical protein